MSEAGQPVGCNDGNQCKGSVLAPTGGQAVSQRWTPGHFLGGRWIGGGLRDWRGEEGAKGKGAIHRLAGGA